MRPILKLCLALAYVIGLGVLINIHPVIAFSVLAVMIMEDIANETA